MIIRIDKNTAFIAFLAAIVVWCLSIYFVSGIVSVALKGIVVGLIMTGVFCYLFKYSGKVSFSKKYVIGCLMLLLGGAIGIVFNPYSVMEIIKNYIVVFILWNLYFFEKDESSDRKIGALASVFYWIFLIFIIFNLINIKNIAGNYTFEIINDQNFTGLMIFLFFIFSWHFKRILGIVACSYFILFFSSSRGLFGMLAFFFLCVLFRENLYFILKKLFFPVWKLMFTLFVVVMLLSVYWVNSISINELAEYREGLNDGSNKMRFSANIYAMKLIEEDGNLWFRGYGNDLKDILGIEEEKPLNEHTRYNDVRLVQPHNSFLNIFLRIGIIPGIIYLGIISLIINKYFNKNTIEFIIPYFINASFMHSFFSGPWFILWLLILYLCANLSGNRVKL